MKLRIDKEDDALYFHLAGSVIVDSLEVAPGVVLDFDAASDAYVVATLRRHLPDEVKHDLSQNINDVPGWAVPLARSIVSDHTAVA